MNSALLGLFDPITLLAQGPIYAEAYAGRSSLHPVVALFLVFAAATALFGRNKVLLFFVLLGSVAMVTAAQRLVIGGVNFSIPRLVILMFVVRMIVRSKQEGIKHWCLIDRLFVALIAFHLIGNTLRADGSIVNRLGFGLDYLGSYLALRSLIRNESDLRAVMVAASILAVLMLPFYLAEWILGRNFLSFMGAVPDFVVVRNGRPRCQGPFSHPINSGLFYGAMLPVFVGYFVGKGHRPAMLVAGFIASTLILITSSSSTPASIFVTASIVWLLFPIRKIMPVLAWCSIPAAVWAHFFLNKGLPSLFAKLDLLSGSTGWHRYHLIDRAIKHFDEWWIVGITGGSGHWGYGLQDVTNEYILHGLQGGVVAMLLMIAIMLTACILAYRASIDGGQSRLGRAVAFGVLASVIAVAAALTSVTMFSGIFVMASVILASAVALAEQESSPTPTKRPMSYGRARHRQNSQWIARRSALK